MLPNCIIIGAMKSGTTSLFQYIVSHPDINKSSIKETDFFKTNSNFKKGVSEYERLFQGNGCFACEASPNYSKQHIYPGVPERMHSILPEIKLIYLVRDPLERIISHYIHNIYQGRLSDPFSIAIKEINKNMIQTSKYYFQIHAFLEYYSDKNILVIQTEKLKKDAASVLIEVSHFFEISANFDIETLNRKFHVSSVKTKPSKIELRLRRMTKNPYLVSKIKKFTNSFRTPLVRPSLTEYDKEFLNDQLAHDIEKFRSFTGMKFSDWSI